METYKKFETALCNLSVDFVEEADLKRRAKRFSDGDEDYEVIGPRGARRCVTFGRNNKGKYYAYHID